MSAASLAPTASTAPTASMASTPAAASGARPSTDAAAATNPATARAAAAPAAGASWAITGLACRYPGIPSAQALWARLQSPSQPAPDPAAAAAAPRRLEPPSAGYADFGIPPIYRGSINRVQLDVLEVARQALAQAGLEEGALDAQRTDVIFCTAFGLNRCFENHARILGVELADAWARALPAALREGFVDAARLRLNQAFAATSHDKVGEMASSIASRVAGCLKLRGRALALEAQDLGGVQALLAAIEALEQGRADAVLVAGVQRIESALAQRLLAQRLGPRWAGALCEGACAVVLQSATAAPARVLARLAAPRRIPAAVGGVAALARPLAAGRPAWCATGGLVDEAATRALAAQGHQVRSARAHCGLGHAIEALSTLAHAVLAQRHLAATGDTATPVLALGQALEGDCWAMAVHPAQAAIPAAALRSTPVAEPAPVAVLGLGARFGRTAGAAAYWEALCSARPQFRPLEDARFQPALFHAADESAPLGYCVGAASHADLPAPRDPLESAAAALAAGAAAEALAALRAPAAWADGPVLVVTASNLTLEPERRLGALEHLPRIEAELDALAQALGQDAPQRARGLQALRAAAGPLPPGEAPSAARWFEQATASAISRRVAALLGAPDADGLALEAACAGSLAAVELAMDRLRSGRCRLAVVVGVELPVNVHDLCLCSAQRMLAPALIATFTEQATGFTPGDGAGVLVLALHGEARRRGERPLALLRAAGSCTESKSVIAPNPSGQVKSMRRAFAQVGFGPADVDFVETHGTGTLIGDEVELESLAAVYAAPRAAPLRLGALKAQFGHCFAAAGMASLVKTVLALRHGRIPANHYAHPLKAALRFEERGFDPLRGAAAWPRLPGRVRRAAVNGFGTGGVNVHLLLEDVAE